MLIRFLIWSVFIYLLARLLWRILDAFVKGVRQPPRAPGADDPPKNQTAEYKDIEDAKFVDVPNSSDDRRTKEADSQS